MLEKKKIFVIIGSASSNSTNLKIVNEIENITKNDFKLTIFNNLKSLPHFDPDLSADNPPNSIIKLRNEIEKADGIIICTPEYIFSIPSGLKNAIEWCISTTVFSEKPTGLITASASGEKGHEELKLIMKTAMSKFTEETTLLIQGVKGKFDEQNNLNDTETIKKLNLFIKEFKSIM
ncbi:NAD(P)H-dependent FMN reductase [Flavobacterium psychrophilum DSM 3660]|uniref:NADPH-dependent FMN reductase n=1 Tax=Flavobacterium psychrophilum TaxID=96345 RepID=UPI0004F73EAB|nr:NADPH-dependent FMN reductase [Flavobacterium psychrophilum]AIN74990.1 FMN reductase [Flavobacterium psychrophilum FPG3]MBF2045440.1 NAD(P)H-dependent oxidoreductase [Flavobacterium psychrophilum]OXB10012.1 NAD(P)H-dependent oxidoreductase [Flavobacterium psychrophilum DSM 3660 = ATCC 49418]SCY30638.1 NAD(P)H-dependent FMN reductase [Flavobacterium psychrophilum DSM 3660] [Flavobacterium psychrophilum DSM 3660 = ATCC 49418]